MSKWRVYYEDGSTWNWTQGLEDIPKWGVICVLQCVTVKNDKQEYHIVFGSSFYMRADEEWLHSYDNDVIDYLVHDRKIDSLLVGRMTTKETFAAIFAKAKSDKDAENL